jgi:hypothetical protein
MNTIQSIDRADSESLSAAAPDTAEPWAEFGLARRRVETVLLHEIEAMVLFALGAGLDLPPEVLTTRSAPPEDGAPPQAATDPLVRLAALHLTLTRLIAPARGSTLVLLAEQRRLHPVLNAFGPVPQVRWMMAVAAISLALLLGIALSGDVNTENVGKGLLNLDGYKLVVVEIFLVAASAVGATLANLKCVNRYIADCTYDPRFDSSYWSRLVMGMISGVILSQVVFGSWIGSDSTGGATANGDLHGFGQPILAILGGFSAELVHDILTHLLGVVRNALGIRKSPIDPPPAEPPAPRAATVTSVPGS